MADLHSRKDSSPFRRKIIVGLVWLALTTLILAFILPIVRIEFSVQIPSWIPNVLGLHDKLTTWIIEQSGIHTGRHRLFDIVAELFRANENILGALIALFSFVVPLIKIILCGLVNLPNRLTSKRRQQLLQSLKFTSKWSMTDVFVVGMCVVFLKAKGFHMQCHVEAGLYCLALSAILSTLAVALTPQEYLPPISKAV